MSRERLKFRLITIASDEQLFEVVARGMRDAARAMDVEAELVGTPGFEVSAVISLVRTALADRMDGIGLNIFHPSALAPAILEASSAGVPVVAFNIDAAETGGGNLSFIMQDFIAAGVALGKRAAAAIAPGDGVIVSTH